MGEEELLSCVKTTKASVKHSRRRNLFVFLAVSPILMYTNDFETLLCCCCLHLCTRLKVKFLAAAEFDILLGD